MSSMDNIKVDVAIIRDLVDRGLQGPDIGLRDALCEIRAMCSDLDKDIEGVAQELMRIADFFGNRRR